MKPQLISLLMGGITLLAVPAGAADETINCTATPDCTALGYTQSADSCPDGGIKCPFDEDRMFCLRSADLGFRIKNDVKVGDYLYTDGTSSATYTSGKGMVGIVLRPHPGNPRHALIVMLPNQTDSYTDSVTINRAVGMAACSDGFGKGIFGTGKYLAGIGETIEFVGLRRTFNNKLHSIKSNYHYFTGNNSGSNDSSSNTLSSTRKDSSSYYDLSSSGSISSGNNNTTSGLFVCVMYL